MAQEQGILESIGSAALQGIDNMINFAIKGLGGVLDRATSALRESDSKAPVLSLSGVKNAMSFGGGNNLSASPDERSPKLGRSAHFHEKQLSVEREIAPPRENSVHLDLKTVARNNGVSQDTTFIGSPYNTEVTPSQFTGMNNGKYAVADISPGDQLMPMMGGVKQVALGQGIGLRS